MALMATVQEAINSIGVAYINDTGWGETQAELEIHKGKIALKKYHFAPGITRGGQKLPT